jgi:hypothetical protein
VSDTFLASLLAQAVTVLAVRVRLRAGWLRHPVSWIVLASAVNQAVGPLLLAIGSVGAGDTFATGVSRGYIDTANLIMSGAMLVFTAGYLLTAPVTPLPPGRPGPAFARSLNWRLLAAACVPLALVTASGRGYGGGSGSGQGAALSTNLTTSFFVVVVVLAAAAFLLRHGVRWFLPVVVAQSLLLTVSGERTPVLTDAITLPLLLLFAGVRVPGRQLVATTVLTALAMLAISGVRVIHGRDLFYSDSGISARVSALAGGLSGIGQADGAGNGPGLVGQLAVRIAGVDFAGAILQAVAQGQPRLSAAYVPESMLEVVPSFLWPTKLDHGLTLNPAQLEMNDFGLQQINFIPGMPGLYVGFLAPPWLLALFGFLGLVFGRFERWLLRDCTAARLVLFAGAMSAALLYEAGLPAMLVQMRAAAVVALAVKLIESVRRRRRARPPAFRAPAALLRLPVPAGRAIRGSMASGDG